MEPQTHDLKSNFCEALEQLGGADRAAFLARACFDNPDALAQLEEMLAARERACGFLGSAPGTPTSDLGPASAQNIIDFVDACRASMLGPSTLAQAEGTGTRIGPYKLVRKLGQGGMGAVFMAEQETPVRRRVALKVIKAGMDSAQVVARFEAERQALALMDHPNIARVFDAGTTDAGRPFFVMELVEGIPITHFCDQGRLNLNQRLELFTSVCRAIQHAHQKGIIHRDIKPSNVLVTSVDPDTPGAPKVIDFGVAKAVDQRLTEKTLFTQCGSIVGTLEYMSPEQAGLSGIDVDTRSDVYALGVLLYELLTGTTPLEHDRLFDAGYTEILRRIKDEEPPKPSTRLTESPERLALTAAVRGTEPTRLTRAIRGDLDWIVMKAIDKSRTRRYDSAGGFARDIQRYLDGDAVEACPPSAVYRLRKFGRKYRWPVTVAAAFAGLVLVGSVISIALAVRATIAEAAAKAEGEKSRRSALQAEAVIKFFQENILATARPEGEEGGLGLDVTVREAVDTAALKIPDQLKDQPTVEAFIRSALGVSYILQGAPRRAVEELERGTQLFEAQLGPDNPKTLDARNSLAEAYHAAGCTAQAIPVHEATLKARESQLGPDNPDTLISRASLARDYDVIGQSAKAIRLNEATLKAGEKILGPDHRFVLAVRNNLAAAFMSVGRTAEAIKIYEQTLNTSEIQLGPDNPATLTVRSNLASAYEASGRVNEAITLHEATLAGRELKLGPDHPTTLISRGSLAFAYRSGGRTCDAIKLYESTCKKLDAMLGPDHPSALACWGGLADAYLSAGRTNDAVELYEATIKGLERTVGPDAADTLALRSSLGGAYVAAGRPVDAINLCEMTIKTQFSTLGPDNAATLACGSNLALAYYSVGRRADAIKLYESTIKAQEKTLGPDHPNTRQTRAALMRRYYESGLFERALPLYLHEFQYALGAHGPRHINTVLAMRDLAEVYTQMRRYDQAEPLFQQALAGLEDRPGNDPIVVLTKRYLSNMYAAQGKFAQVLHSVHGAKDCGKQGNEADCRTRGGKRHGPAEPEKP